MTIGIGGWGSRRKPMSLVRAILRSDLSDLTDRHLRRPRRRASSAPRARSASWSTGSSRWTRSRSSRTSAPPARRARSRPPSTTRACCCWGLYAAAARLPFLPTRAGLGSDVMQLNPDLRTVDLALRRRRGAGRRARPRARRGARAPEPRRRRAATPQFSGPTRTSTTCSAWPPSAPTSSCERGRPDRRAVAPARPGDAADLPVDVSGVVEAPNGAHFTSCEPDYGRDEAFQRATPRPPASPTSWAQFRGRVPGGRRGRLPGRGGRARSAGGLVSAAVTAARTRSERDGRGDARGRRLRRRVRRGVAGRRRDSCATRSATCPTIGARLARATFEPHLVLTDGERRSLAGRDLGGRRGRPDVPTEGWIPYRTMFDLLWQGRRHVMMGAEPDRPVRQREHLRDRRLRTAPPSAARLPRRARQHGQPPDQLLGAAPLAARLRAERRHGRPASATTAPPRPGPGAAGSTTCAGSSRTWACSTCGRGRTARMRLVSVHPGVTVDEVVDGDRLRAGHPRGRAETAAAHGRGAAPDPRGASTRTAPRPAR